MASSEAIGGIIAALVIVFIVGGTIFCCFYGFGGGQKVRRCCGCTTVRDEEAEEMRDANRRNKELRAMHGPGVFMGRGTDTVGNNIFNPWAAQSMGPGVQQQQAQAEQPAAAGGVTAEKTTQKQQPFQPPQGMQYGGPSQNPTGSWTPGVYPPGQGYPYAPGWQQPPVIPVGGFGAPAPAPGTPTSPPPVYRSS